MIYVIIVAVLAFVAGVAEGQRVINAVDRAAAELHARIAKLEEAVKGKL